MPLIRAVAIFPDPMKPHLRIAPALDGSLVVLFPTSVPGTVQSTQGISEWSLGSCLEKSLCRIGSLRAFDKKQRGNRYRQAGLPALDRIQYKSEAR